MGFLFLALYASTLAAVLVGGPLGARGDNVPWWSVDSGPLSPPHGSSFQDIGRNQWFTVYPESYQHHDGSRITTSTLSPLDNSQYNEGYQIIDLRT